MKNVSNRKKIVFIVSSSHSGSTLLDMIIGGHSLCFSLGEIVHLLHEVDIKGICACRKPIQECKIWSKVTKNLATYLKRLGHDIQEKELRHLNINLTKRNIIELLFPLSKAKLDPLEYKKFIIINKIYKSVFKYSDKSVLIDSSKSFWRPILFRKFLPEEYDYYVIHLIRDGRGVLYSNMKKNYKVEFMGNKLFKRPNITPPEKIIKAWIKVNILTLLVLKSIFRRKYLLLKYENICSIPKVEIKKIANFLSIDYQSNMISFQKVIHHNIGGNPTRYSKSGIRPVDEEWKKKLSPELIKIFNKKASWLNNLVFEYKKIF